MAPRTARFGRRGLLLGLVCFGWLAAGGQVRGEEAAPLTFSVRPSGVEGAPAEPETLDEKLARRDGKFRFICTGCVRGGRTESATPFRPIDTLNSPQLTRALSGAQPPEEESPTAD
ncbi:MAG: hypothetical protein JWR08_1681 [Enterovirga sp.]|nr:hypothetical protein [Enterovirga sp.]